MVSRLLKIAAFCLLVGSSLTLAQQTLIPVNWTWFFETSNLLYFGAFETAEAKLREVETKDYSEDIQQLETRSQEIVVLLSLLNSQQEAYQQRSTPIPLDLIYFTNSVRALYVGIGALRNVLYDQAGRSVDESLTLLYIAESSYNTHQLAYTLFTQQPVASIQR